MFFFSKLSLNLFYIFIGGKKMKNLFAKYAGVIAALALMVTAANVNHICVFVAHQPEMPEGAEKLRRL